MENQIADLKVKMVEWDNTQNEGSHEGYNPYRDQIEEIQTRLTESKNITWTKEITMERRSEWKEWVLSNAVNGKVDGITVSKQINLQGWNLQELKKNIKKYNL